MSAARGTDEALDEPYDGPHVITWTCHECGAWAEHVVRNRDSVPCPDECDTVDVARYRYLPMIGGVVDVTDPYGDVTRHRLHAIVRVGGRAL